MNQLLPATDRAAGKSPSISQSVNQSQIYWTLLLRPFEEILTVPALYQEGHLQVLWFASGGIWGVFEQRMPFNAGRWPFQSITLMLVLFSAALHWLFPLTIFSGLLFNQNLLYIFSQGSEMDSILWVVEEVVGPGRKIKWWALPICSECMEYLSTTNLPHI